MLNDRLLRTTKETIYFLWHGSSSVFCASFGERREQGEDQETGRRGGRGGENKERWERGEEEDENKEEE